MTEPVNANLDGMEKIVIVSVMKGAILISSLVIKKEDAICANQDGMGKAVI